MISVPAWPCTAMPWADDGRPPPHAEHPYLQGPDPAISSKNIEVL